jgi:phospholipase C
MLTATSIPVARSTQSNQTATTTKIRHASPRRQPRSPGSPLAQPPPSFVRAGFGDPQAMPGVFSQPGYPVAGYDGVLQPCHIDTHAGGACTNDINHSWGPQHTYWDSGKLDAFVKGHVAVDGVANGALTMG